MEAFLGDWKLESTSASFDDVMTRLGVGYLARKAGNSLKPTVTFSRSTTTPGAFVMRNSSTFKTLEVVFVVGEVFDEVTLDGRKARATIVMRGDTMEQVSTDVKSGKVTRVLRSVQGNQLNTVSSPRFVIALIDCFILLLSLMVSVSCLQEVHVDELVATRVYGRV